MQLRDRSPVDASVVVLIPVLDRPHRVAPVVESIVRTSQAAIQFVVTDGDKKEIKAIRKAQSRHPQVGMQIVEPHPYGDYARKINQAFRSTSADWYFQGADDLVFHPEWLVEALRIARGKVARVIGTQDLCNPRTRSGRHSTHSLVHRSYVEEYGTIDEPGVFLHEGYSHGFVDDELVWSAIRRGEFAFASRSIVEHLHPTRRTAEMDSTYEKALDRHAFARDRGIFRQRQRLMSRRVLHRRRSMR